jgi:hypothetical protein
LERYPGNQKDKQEIDEDLKLWMRYFRMLRNIKEYQKSENNWYLLHDK